MPTVFWTGELSFLLKLIVNFSNLIAWITGNARNSHAMKERMMKGYNGEITKHVARYDELGDEHYRRISESLIEELDVSNSIVLDIGCGTGILSFVLLEKGVKKVIGGDLSENMLSCSLEKARDRGYDSSEAEFRQCDIETLPFESGTFDNVTSSMILGLVPDQRKAMNEITRVLKPGGTIAVATHGPKLYFEACEVAFRVIPKKYVLGYRIEFWPLTEKVIARYATNAGLKNVTTKRMTWKEKFQDGKSAYDFFVSTSSAWWYAKFPPDVVIPISQKVRSAFEKRKTEEITMDVVFVYGTKPKN